MTSEDVSEPQFPQLWKNRIIVMGLLSGAVKIQQGNISKGPTRVPVAFSSVTLPKVTQGVVESGSSWVLLCCTFVTDLGYCEPWDSKSRFSRAIMTHGHFIPIFSAQREQ